MIHKIRRIDWDDGEVTFDVTSDDGTRVLLSNQKFSFDPNVYTPTVVISAAVRTALDGVLSNQVTTAAADLVARHASLVAQLTALEANAVEMNIISAGHPALLTQ